MGLEAQLDVAVDGQARDAGQHLVGAALADAEGVEALQARHAGDAAQLEQARDHLLVEHAPHLARHAGREQETRAADGDGEAAGRADRIVDELGVGGQHRLLAIVGRHHATAPRIGLGHARHPGLVQHQRDAARLGRQLLRKIVDRGAQPAVHDDGVGALARLPEGLEQGVAIVADRRAPMHVESDFRQASRHETVIGVDRLAGQDLVTGAQDFDSHQAPPPPV